MPRPQSPNLRRNLPKLFEMSEVRNDPHVRTLRDYLQPIRGSTPLCVVFPPNAGTFEIKPGVIQLLLKFYGLDSESPYLHLKEFDKVCRTLHFAGVT